MNNCPKQMVGYDGGGFTAFGELTFDPAAEQVPFRLISEAGPVLEEHVLPAARLQPGQAD